MKRFITACLIFLTTGSQLKAGDDNIAKANGIEISYETFGQESDPALLLVMGACAQGILWPSEFCERLSNAGFYVIRYDHRDAGYSTCFNFHEQPYDLLDMAKDAIGLLDFLEIEKTHAFGLSMGGPIVELMAAYFPTRVLSITLMATSCDFRPLHRAFDGLPPQQGSLSGPKESYLASVKKATTTSPKTTEEKIAQKVERWQLLSGSVVPFEEDLYFSIFEQFFTCLKSPASMNNHLLANRISEELICAAPSKVHAPALILHGSEDPIFPPDHGEALSAAIFGSKYVFVEGMGHVVNRYFYDLIINEICGLAECAAERAKVMGEL